MTIQQLNKDIKRLYKDIQIAKSKGNVSLEDGNKVYFDYIDKIAKPEFTRLYYADRGMVYMNRLSIKLMLSMNISHALMSW